VLVLTTTSLFHNLLHVFLQRSKRLNSSTVAVDCIGRTFPAVSEYYNEHLEYRAHSLQGVFCQWHDSTAQHCNISREQSRLNTCLKCRDYGLSQRQCLLPNSPHRMEVLEQFQREVAVLHLAISVSMEYWKVFSRELCLVWLWSESQSDPTGANIESCFHVWMKWTQSWPMAGRNICHSAEYV
jgi:hypothetical protein